MALPTSSNSYDNKMPGLWEEVATGGSLPVDDTFFYVDETLVDCMGENIYTDNFASGVTSYSDEFASGVTSYSDEFPTGATVHTAKHIDPGDEDSGGSLLVSRINYYVNETLIDCLGRDIWS